MQLPLALTVPFLGNHLVSEDACLFTQIPHTSSHFWLPKRVDRVFQVVKVSKANCLFPGSMGRWAPTTALPTSNRLPNRNTLGRHDCQEVAKPEVGMSMSFFINRGPWQRLLSFWFPKPDTAKPPIRLTPTDARRISCWKQAGHQKYRSKTEGSRPNGFKSFLQKTSYLHPNGRFLQVMSSETMITCHPCGRCTHRSLRLHPAKGAWPTCFSSCVNTISQLKNSISSVKL